MRKIITESDQGCQENKLSGRVIFRGGFVIEITGKSEVVSVFFSKDRNDFVNILIPSVGAGREQLR
jgi:hypothetical protein